MKKILTILSVLIFASFALSAQNNNSSTKAKSILDKVSQKTKSFKTISLTYSLTHSSPETTTEDKTSGKMYIKGNKYQLSIFDNVLYCDGKSLATHMIEEKEVVISNVENQESDLLNPSKVLTMYEKGFKYKFIQERFEQNRAIYVIDLYPEDVKTSEYSKVRLSIDKDKSQLWKVEYFAKDGNKYIIQISSFKVNEELAESTFTFDKSKHSDVKIIDER